MVAKLLWLPLDIKESQIDNKNSAASGTAPPRL
jgi:hypothetical protein